MKVEFMLLLKHESTISLAIKAASRHLGDLVSPQKRAELH